MAPKQMKNDDTLRQIRAVFDEETIRVYQAYANPIADSAIRNGTFTSPFKMSRMTWIKPSFLWMMYRSGWAEKTGQERILAIDITRDGFEWALRHSVPSTFIPVLYASRDEWRASQKGVPVRIQWDPERNIRLGRLDHRSIQIGLQGDAVRRYIREWVVRIDDLTSFCRNVARMVQEKNIDKALKTIPQEKPYPLPDALREYIGAS